jgi:hypothetical protein
VIIGMVVLWYGIVPVAGALVKRWNWRRFRRRFDELRLSPMLDYGRCRRLERPEDGGGGFRFIGGFESVTDGQTLWIRGENLTMPVSLKDAQTYLLPMQEGESIPEAFDPGEEAPERIRWDRVSALTEGARVFVGGSLVFQDNRWIFVSTREKPLLVIFFDGSDHSLTMRAIRAGRQRNEYWNAVTPYSLVVGALCQILMAASFLSRPAFRLTVITAIIALFTPLFPLIPPGLLFTVMYRRLAWRARILRAYRDLSLLPLRYLAPDTESCRLPDGEPYGCVRRDSLPAAAREGKIPFLLPEYSKESLHTDWYIFGALRPSGGEPGAAGGGLPARPADPFATFGILPGKPEVLARRFMVTAYTLEAAAWVLLLAGIGLNVFFIRMILVLL